MVAILNAKLVARAAALSGVICAQNARSARFFIFFVSFSLLFFESQFCDCQLNRRQHISLWWRASWLKMPRLEEGQACLCTNGSKMWECKVR